MTSFFIAATFYFKSALKKRIVQQKMAQPYTAVFGLTKMSETLLKNEMSSTHTQYLLIENLTSSLDLEHYLKNGIAVINGDLFESDFLQTLDFQHMEKALISLGNDRLNIEAVSAIIKHYQLAEKKDTALRIIVEIRDRTLNELVFQNLINTNLKNKKIEIQPFSFFEACADQLFQMHDVDANDYRIIESEVPFSIAVVGDGLLLREVVYQIGLLAHLPNKNLLKIHIVDRDASAIKLRLLCQLEGIERVVNLVTHTLDSDILEFYTNDLWHQANLTRIILCDDDEEKNVAIAANLFNKTYFKQALTQKMTTEVFFAVFNSHSLNDDIASNHQNLKSFQTFGEMNQICTRDIIINDSQNKIGRLIHYSYGDLYNPQVLQGSSPEKIAEIDSKWFATKDFSDKFSSVAQAKHIKMKLKALHLGMEENTKLSPEDLLDQNRKLFNNALNVCRKEIGLEDEMLIDYSQELENFRLKKPFAVKYFPKTPRNLFEKLIYCEHERWNAFQYMNGWTYADQKEKSVKEHDCLKPLEAFEKPEHQLTVIYDMYSILYIPNYLANTGYIINAR